MRRIRIITMALVAVFCLSAVGASSALATEKKGEIVNKNGGVPTKAKFLGTSSTPGELETIAGSKIKCTGTTVAGTIESKTTGTANFAFTGCTNASGNCFTSGAAAKEIKVTSVALKAAPKEGKDFILNDITVTITLFCGVVKIEVKGSLLIPVKPESKLIKTTERAEFAAKGKAGKQEPEVSTNHLQAKFGAGSLENASLAAEGLQVAFEEEVEFI